MFNHAHKLQKYWWNGVINTLFIKTSIEFGLVVDYLVVQEASSFRKDNRDIKISNFGANA